ncbi:MAG: hypothetical protein QOE36_728 [Gaiellaceae bacterium]|nr:hypothetical protein [Gaiellaceae bacterium]
MAAAWLTELERLLAGSPVADGLVLVAAAAGRDVSVDADEAHGVVRRALLLHAAGGDALRPYDLDAAGRRAELARGLERLAAEAAGLPRVESARRTLAAEPDLAWRAYACAVLLEGLEADG